MKLKQSLAALTLALLAGSAFAATTPAANTQPASSPAPAASKPAHKANKLHCKEGEAVVKGKCEKKPA
jgi:hypothetical protein